MNFLTLAWLFIAFKLRPQEPSWLCIHWTTFRSRSEYNGSRADANDREREGISDAVRGYLGLMMLLVLYHVVDLAGGFGMHSY